MFKWMFREKLQAVQTCGKNRIVSCPGQELPLQVLELRSVEAGRQGLRNDGGRSTDYMALTFLLIFENFHNNNFFLIWKKYSGLWRLSPFLPQMTTKAILGKSPSTSCFWVPDSDVVLDIYLSVSLFDTGWQLNVQKYWLWSICSVKQLFLLLVVNWCNKACCFPPEAHTVLVKHPHMVGKGEGINW